MHPGGGRDNRFAGLLCGGKRNQHSIVMSPEPKPQSPSSGTEKESQLA
jgi:hypothetical protein